MSFATVQVFEHTTIAVGESLRTADGRPLVLTRAHHDALAAFADATTDAYLACGRSTVRFSSFVGVLQVGRLVIEILPKADRSEVGGYGRWHRALLRMLRVVGDLGLRDLDEAHLRTEPGRMFELFVNRFLDECAGLVREGLAKGYRTIEENRSSFRGRLLVSRHVRVNASNAARFYVASPVYDHENVPNLALHEALRVVEQLPLSNATRARACGVRSGFPELAHWEPSRDAIRRIRFTRRTARYRSALRFAELILFHLAPSLRSGQAPMLALLFDMNRLWERYVAALARRLALPGVDVTTQTSRDFWRGAGATRTLIPDIAFTERNTERVLLIVDTKWKLPVGGAPTGDDVGQMYCYHELFACPRTMLLYPSTTTSHLGAVGKYDGREHRCSLAFLAVDGDIRSDLDSLIRSAIAGDGAASVWARSSRRDGDPDARA